MISYWDGRWFEKNNPPPPAAPPSSGDQETAPTYVAVESLSALRVVRVYGVGSVCLARPPEIEASAPLGITTTAAAAGGDVTIAKSGELSDASWSWTVGGPILLGANGVLTQAQPSDQPFLVVVGLAVSETLIVVRIGLPIFVDIA